MSWTPNLIPNLMAGLNGQIYINLIRSRLREVNTSFIDNTELLDIINLARLSLARDYNIFVKTATWYAGGSPPQEWDSTIDYPDDLISHTHIIKITYNGNNMNILPAQSNGSMFSDTGIPTEVMPYDASCLLLYPICSEGTVVMKYYFKLPDIELEQASPETYSDDTLPEYFKNYIAFKSMAEIFGRRRDENRQNYFESLALHETDVLLNARFASKSKRENIFVYGGIGSRTTMSRR